MSTLRVKGSVHCSFSNRRLRSYWLILVMLISSSLMMILTMEVMIWVMKTFRSPSGT